MWGQVFQAKTAGRGAPKLNKENEKGGIGGQDRDFSQCLRSIREFQTFLKKVRVSPSGGINRFGECGLMARVRRNAERGMMKREAEGFFDILKSDA